MELPDLRLLKTKAESLVRRKFPNAACRFEIGYEESPNPVCFIEIDGLRFTQARFWANNEFLIESIRDDQDLISFSGDVENAASAIAELNKALETLES